MQFLKWLYPGMRFKRWLALFAVGVMMASIGLAIALSYKYVGNIEEAIFRAVYMTTGTYYYTVTVVVGISLLGVGIVMMILSSQMIVRSVTSVIIPDSSEKLVDLMFEKRKLNKGPAITVIGGGTGLSVLLRGLKCVTSNVTAVVTVADDGGSSGRIRQDLGIIPPGDFRNCLVALADTEPLMEKLFQHRFGGKGDLAGHSFGNLFIAAMAEVLGDVEKALKESSKVLAVKGKVLPSSTETVRLFAEMADGTIVEGESQIPLANQKINKVFLEPADVAPVKSSLDALKESDAIILGPGSLYTSVLPNLLVNGIAETIKNSKAIKIYICNVMTQPGETDDYTASMHIKALLDHVGPGIIDYVIVNSKEISLAAQEMYADQGAKVVKIDESEIDKLGVKLVKANIINETNLVRHDPVKLSRTIMKMVYDLKSNSERMKLLDYYLINDNVKEQRTE